MPNHTLTYNSLGVRNIQGNKSPGNDVLTAKFFKDVFDLVGTDQINSLNQAIEDVNYL